MIVTCLVSLLLAGEMDADKLRQLARMPKNTLLLATSFSTSGYFEWGSEDSAFNVRMRELDAEKADSADALFRAIRRANAKKDRAQADEHRAKLLQLLEGVLADHPGDAKLMVDVARGFSLCHRSSEAEALLLRAKEMDPEEPEILESLEGVLINLAWADAAKAAGLELASNQREELTRYFRSNPPTLETTQRVHALFDRAGQYCQEGIALWPERGESFVSRASVAWCRSDLDEVLNGGKRPPLTRFTTQFLADVRQAAALMPRDSKAQRMAIMAEVASLASAGRFETKGPPTPEVLDEISKQLEPYRERLSASAQSEDPQIAARGFVGVGFINIVLRRPREVEKLARRALERDPSCWEASDLLLSILGEELRWNEVITLLLERKKRDASIRTQLFLASAYAKNGQEREAEAQLRAILLSSSDNVPALLGVAALLLRRSDCDHRELARHLEKAKNLLTADSDEELRITYELLDAIETALTGHPADAAKRLESLRQKLADLGDADAYIARVNEVLAALQ